MTDRSKLQDFLEKISFLESSGGKNVAHKRMLAGPHAGEAAMGQYGIMPNTAEEFITRRKRRGQFGPDENIMSQMSPEQLTEFLAQQKRIEQNLAQDIGEHLLRRTGGDEEKAAYMWQMGHNLDPKKITPETLERSERVQRFRRTKEMIGPKKEGDGGT
jgi:hypothetical protein